MGRSSYGAKKAKATQSIQVKQEKDYAAVKRQNISKKLSDKRTFQEVAGAAIDFTGRYATLLDARTISNCNYLGSTMQDANL